jgi:transposase-like protein
MPSVIKLSARFGSDEDCLKYIQEMRWPDGVVRCPQCGSKDVKRVERSVTKKGKNRRGWFFLCGEKTCRNQFSATSGTLFHDTHLPLIIWFHAIVLILNAKKGISAAQLQRDLGIGGYKTAWYLNHRIREAMRVPKPDPPHSPVVVDEQAFTDVIRDLVNSPPLPSDNIKRRKANPETDPRKIRLFNLDGMQGKKKR